MNYILFAIENPTDANKQIIVKMYSILKFLH